MLTPSVNTYLKQKVECQTLGIVLGVAKGSIGENKFKANAAIAFCAKMFRFKSIVFCFLHRIKVFI